MDFLDFETFSTGGSSLNQDGTVFLPEPVVGLSLNSLSFDQNEQFEEINISGLLSKVVSDKGGKKLTLHEKMSNYAKISTECLNVKTSKEDKVSNALPSYIPETSRGKIDITQLLAQQKSQNSKTTNMILNKKLSKVFNELSFGNYQTTSVLRKSLAALEDSYILLSLSEDNLTNPGYTGTLARKTLKSDVETSLLKEHLRVLDDFRPIINKVKTFSDPIKAINSTGSNLINNLENTDNDSQQSMLNKIDKLYEKISDYKLKKKLLLTIKDQYTLTQVEDDIILNGPVNDELFKVVDKILSIKKKSMYLLGLPITETGSALISDINKKLSIVNKRLYNYLLDFLYNFESSQPAYLGALETSNESSLKVFQRSLMYLSVDFELLNEFFKKVTSIRSKFVLDQFLIQFDLNNKDIKPVLLSSDNPVRYIGDIFASIYSLIANEADFVKSLFDVHGENLDDLSSLPLEQEREFFKDLDTKLLNDIIQSLANTSRIRIAQVVKFEDDQIVRFEIIQLIRLYKMMFQKKGIKNDSSLINNLKTLESLSVEMLMKHYLSCIENAEKIDNPVALDLLPPEWLNEYFTKLSELLEVSERYYGDNDDQENSILNYEFLENVVKRPLSETLNKQIKLAFPSNKRDEQARSDLLTVQINSYDLVKSRLAPFASKLFPATDSRNEIYSWIVKSYDDSISLMLNLQMKILFTKTGLGLYQNLMNMIFPVNSVKDELDYDMYLSLTDNSLMSIETIEMNVHEKLNEYLPNALTDLQSNLLFKLSSPTIADDICYKCFKELSVFYSIFRRVLVHLYPEQKQIIYDVLNFSEETFDMLVGIK